MLLEPQSPHTQTAWWDGTELNFQYLSPDNRDSLAKLAPDTVSFYRKYVEPKKLEELVSDVVEALETTQDYAQDFAGRTMAYLESAWYPQNKHLFLPQQPPQQPPAVPHSPPSLPPPNPPAHISVIPVVSPPSTEPSTPPTVKPHPPTKATPEGALRLPDPIQPAPIQPALIQPQPSDDWQHQLLQNQQTPKNILESAYMPSQSVQPQPQIQLTDIQDLLTKSLAAQQTQHDQQMGLLLNTMQKMMDQLIRQSNTMNDLTKSVAELKMNVTASFQPFSAQNQPPSQPQPSGQPVYSPPQTSPAPIPVKLGRPPAPSNENAQVALPQAQRQKVSFLLPNPMYFSVIHENMVSMKGQDPHRVYIDYVMVDGICVFEFEPMGTNLGVITIGLADYQRYLENPETSNAVVYQSSGMVYARNKHSQIKPYTNGMRVKMEVNSKQHTVSFAVGDNAALVTVAHIPVSTQAFISFSAPGQRVVAHRLETVPQSTLVENPSYTRAMIMD
ncbi:hypothetical protein BLNAU_16831 [Blattamonas nauphoetae]|uniref:Uncharacterized protein n=1 Tax=Blattamonas nauphoetae TaxID=2049346 RepID=A0ABQ9XAC9_9EUKA|nr:hypothetical protein BLNAU_16831 [Blattamonas nauphoetae]